MEWVEIVYSTILIFSFQTENLCQSPTEWRRQSFPRPTKWCEDQQRTINNDSGCTEDHPHTDNGNATAVKVRQILPVELLTRNSAGNHRQRCQTDQLGDKSAVDGEVPRMFSSREFPSEIWDSRTLMVKCGGFSEWRPKIPLSKRIIYHLTKLLNRILNSVTTGWNRFVKLS